MASHRIDRSGYRARGALSPATVGGVLIVHGLLGAAIVSMTLIRLDPKDIPILWAYNVPKDQPKPDPAPPPPNAQPRSERTTIVTPKVDILPPPPDTHFVPMDPPPPLGGPAGLGSIGPVSPPVTLDPKPPVMIDARPDARYRDAFQPPYPAGMLRLQMEGDVTVRISIDADGRVLDVTLVSAADPAFFEATKKQALARWRFMPATRDGVPVASERVMTVHFKITD